MLVICVNDQHRANDVASFAREQLPRTIGFAMGLEVVFVPQVEVYENLEDQMLFRVLGSLFPLRCGSSGLSTSRLSHVRSPDLPHKRNRIVSQSDGEVG